MTLTRVQSAPRPVTWADGTPSAPMPCWLYPQVPGLYVTERPDDVFGPFYGIHHLASGALFGTYYDTLADAERALEAVAPLFDWTKPMDVLRAEKDLRTTIDPTLPDRLAAALRPTPRRTSEDAV